MGKGKVERGIAARGRVKAGHAERRAAPPPPARPLVLGPSVVLRLLKRYGKA